MRAKIIEANYAGDNGYRAIIDSKGNLHIAEGQMGGNTIPSSDYAISIPAKRAKPIIDELETVSNYGYGDIEINAVQHWILAREFESRL